LLFRLSLEELCCKTSSRTRNPDLSVSVVLFPPRQTQAPVLCVTVGWADQTFKGLCRRNHPLCTIHQFVKRSRGRVNFSLQLVIARWRGWLLRLQFTRTMVSWLRHNCRVICSQLEENASLGPSADQVLFQSAVKRLERREHLVCF